MVFPIFSDLYRIEPQLRFLSVCKFESFKSFSLVAISVSRRLSGLDELYVNEAFAVGSYGCVRQSRFWEPAPVVAVIFAGKRYLGLAVCEGY